VTGHQSSLKKSALSLSLCLFLWKHKYEMECLQNFSVLSKFSKDSDSKHGLTDAAIIPRLKNVHQNLGTNFQDSQTHFDWIQNPFSVQQVAIYFNF
jgi:hypothetical protein